MDRVVGAEVTGLERRCIEQWHDFSELHSQKSALLKSSFLVPADRVVAADVTGLERRCIEQWYDFSELHSQ